MLIDPHVLRDFINTFVTEVLVLLVYSSTRSSINRPIVFSKVKIH